MAELSSIIAAVLSGVLVLALVFYVWGRRVEKHATDQSQRLVLAAKEELMAVHENLHKSLDEKLAGVDRREQELLKLDQQLQDRTKALSTREQDREQKITALLQLAASLSAKDAMAGL